MITVLLLVAAIGALATAIGVWRLGETIEKQRQSAIVQQQLATFAAAAAAAQQDPRQLLVWYPLAQTSRTLFPDAFM